jgi:hypothetical protein
MTSELVVLLADFSDDFCPQENNKQQNNIPCGKKRLVCFML